MKIDTSSACCRAGEDWDCFTYGAKLWKAKSVDDPEIQKLKLLFEDFADTSANEWPARMSI